MLELDPCSAAAQLRARLLEADLSLTADIARTLRALGDHQALALALAGISDRSPSRRLAAAHALAELEGPGVRGALRAALRDPIAGVRATALRGLARLGPCACAKLQAEVARCLVDEQPFVRVQAIGALVRLARQPGALLARAAWDPDALVRERLTVHLAVLPSQAATQLLGDRERAVREAAARSAGLGQVDALAGVARGDPVAAVRQAATARLGELGERRATDTLLDALTDDDALVRAAALDALQRVLGREATIARLRTALGDPRASRRRASLYALAHLRAPEAAAVAVALVADADPQVRMTLVQCAERLLADPHALLARLADDPDPAVRGGAAVRLERLERRPDRRGHAQSPREQRDPR